MSPNRAVANPALLSAFWLLAAWALPASGVKARHVTWLGARPAFRARGFPTVPLRLRGGDEPGAQSTTDDDVVRVLANMLAPDSERISAAEAQMDVLVRDRPVSCINGLVSCLLRDGTAMELRQLAAVLLRRRMPDMWEALSEEQQTLLQQRLGDALVDDLAHTSGKLRRLLALCVAAVAALSSTMMQLDTVVERILAAGGGVADAPETAAVAIEILELLMESMAQDMRRHVDRVHEVVLAGLEQAHTDVRLNSIKLASTLLVQAFGERADASFSSALFRSLHMMLARAVDEGDARVAGAIFVALADVVPFCWGLEASTRTQHLVELALNVTAHRDMPLAVCEQASLFVSEIVNSQPHILRQEHLLGGLTRRVTRDAVEALLVQASGAPNLDQLLCLARGEDSAHMDQALQLQDHAVREKREGEILAVDDEATDDAVGGSIPTRGRPQASGRGVAEGQGSCLSESQARSAMLLRTLHAVLQSDGCDVAVPAFQRQTAASCDQDTCEHAIARLLLLRTCCEAATSCATQRALQCVDVNQWAVGLLQEGLQHPHVSVRRVACHCAAGVLSAVHLTWGERVLFCGAGWYCVCGFICVRMCVRMHADACACVYR